MVKEPEPIGGLSKKRRSCSPEFIRYAGIALILSVVTIPPSIYGICKELYQSNVRIACIEAGGRIEWNECVPPGAKRGD